MGYWLEIATVAGISAVIALGVYITLAAGQISMGHAVFMGLGAYSAAILTKQLNMPLPVSLVGGAVAGAIAAGGFSLFILRLQHLFVAIATLALAGAVPIVLYNTKAVGGAFGYSGVPLLANAPVVFGILAIIILYFVFVYRNSRVEHMFRAVANDEVAAASMGINVSHAKVLAFAMGGFFAGLGGALFVHHFSLIQPSDLGFAQSLTYLLLVIVGGSEVFWGPIAGAFLLAFLPEFLRFSTYERYLIFGVLLVVVIIFRPEGLVRRRPLRI